MSALTSDDYLEARGSHIRRFPRGDFLKNRWKYRRGEHVAFIAPTQDGKTTLAFQLLQVTAGRGLPAYTMVMKPRDPVPAAWTRHLGYKEVPTWPPRKPYPWEDAPNGYTLWPRHTFNVKVDNAHMTDQFEKLIQYGY